MTAHKVVVQTCLITCSSSMRAKRAKPKSCRDDMILAQGQRGTNAALGSERKMICSPFSGLVRGLENVGAPVSDLARFGQPRDAGSETGAPSWGARQTRKGGRVGTGWLLPRAIILLPLRGAGQAKRIGGGRENCRLAVYEPAARGQARMRLAVNNLRPGGMWTARSWVNDWPSQ